MRDIFYIPWALLPWKKERLAYLGQLLDVDRSSERLVTERGGQVDAFIVGVISTSSLESKSDARAVT